jgi:hypothetical protein
VHPTAIPAGFGHEAWTPAATRHAGESVGATSATFDPNEPVFNNPRQRNAMFTFRKPQEALIRLGRDFGSNSPLHDYVAAGTAPSERDFGVDRDAEPRGSPVQVPGIHTPYLGEPDKKLMEAMAVPALRDGSAGRTVCINAGRYSKSIYINAPDRGNVLRGRACRDLAVVLDMHTNGVRTKLVVLKAAQSGKTDAFCGGLDLQELAHNVRMHDKSRAAASGSGLPFGPSGLT